jgi:CO/xanthine dehydrogenase Mo-binding subunit
MVPGGGFRGHGSSQTTFAIESAIDELGRLLGMSPFEIRRKNMVRPTDWIESVWKDPSDASFGSYGLDQCLDLVEKALASGGGDPKPTGDDWMEGTGIALAMLDCGPPTEHRSGAQMAHCPTAAITLRLARPKWATDRSLHTGRSPPPSLVREGRASPSSTPTPI